MKIEQITKFLRRNLCYRGVAEGRFFCYVAQKDQALLRGTSTPSFNLYKTKGQRFLPGPLQGIVMNQCTIRFFPFWMTIPL